MGWSIEIKANRPVSNSVIESAINSMPDSMKGINMKTDYGWHTAVDIRREGSCKIITTGSYSVSGNIAEGFAEAFARRLEKRGYVVEVGAME